MGYTHAELDEIQVRWKLRFPPDLLELLTLRRPLLSDEFDWISTPREEIEQMLNWPSEGFTFDVLENGLWWPLWGSKPRSSLAQGRRVEQILAGAPQLIPLSAHRYIPESPHERGNPIFSVHQSDVIYYGTDLADWILREKQGWTAGRLIDPSQPPKEIQFWSEAVRRSV